MKVLKIVNIPRIIGIILIILGIIFFKAETQTIMTEFLKYFSLISGLILLLSKKKQTNAGFKLFLKSFKGISLLWTTLIEITYWLMAILIMLICGIFLKGFAKTLSAMLPAKADLISAIPDIAIIQKYFYLAIIILIIGIVLWNKIYSTSRAINWAIIKKKKFTFKFWIKCSLMTFVWWVLWTPIVLIVLFGLKEQLRQPVFVILVMLYIYFAQILFYNFLKINKIWKTIKETISSGINNFYKFLIPYSFAFVLIIALIFINNYIPQKGQIVSSLIITAFFIAWLRKYLNAYMKEIIKI